MFIDMTITIEHKFIDFLEPDWNFETLYVGTFNPRIYDKKNEKNNTIDFFYGRPKNLFWEVMPKVHNKSSLIRANKQTKINFLKENKIAVTDLVSSVSFTIDKKEEAEKRLLTYSDANINYFIPKDDNDRSVSISMTNLNRIFHNNNLTIKRIILTRQNPTNEKFIRITWEEISNKFKGKVFTVWSPSCWGLKSKKIGLTREQALYNKWIEMLN